MIKVVARDRAASWKFSALVSASALATALILGAGVMALSGVDPAQAYGAMLDAALLGGAWALADTATQATPLIFTGLACGMAFRAGLWNVGAEGQLLIGAWAATGVASFWLPPDTPGWAMLPSMAVAAFACGAVWAAVPGLLKARLGVSEILSSLMLVYVAASWNNYFIYSPWSYGGFQMTPAFPESAWMPQIGGLFSWFADLKGGRVHLGLVLALLAAAVVWVVVSRTRFGYSIRLMGASRDTAAYAGVSVARTTVLVMAISGGLAGLAGMVELSGVVHHLQERFSPGYGFTGILIAWLARLNPAGIVAAALLFGGLLVGSREVQPSGVALMLQGVVLLTLMGFEGLLRYRVVVER